MTCGWQRRQYGILHPLVADQMRDADGGAFHQAAQRTRRLDLAGVAAQRVDARIERRIGAARRVGRERAGDQRRAEQRLGLEQAGQRIGGRELRAVQQGKPFLGAEHQRRQARPRPAPARPAPPRRRRRRRRRRSSPPTCGRAARDRPRRRPSPGPARPASGPWRAAPRAGATVSPRTPDAPWARLASLSAIISRATATGIGGPTPAACDSTMLRCSFSRSAASMRTLASLPKPVLMP